MKLALLIGFLTILVESTILSVPLTLSYILVMIILFETGTVFWIFLAGLLLDLFAHRLFGISSLFFLFVFLAVRRYQEKINVNHFFYTVLFLGITCSLYLLLIYRYLNWEKLLLGVGFGAIVFLILGKVQNNIKGRKKLTL
ncbi:hypothetical protein MUP32_04735 [Candidatus Microgenomates bacterium]|nr:hypothetical protein [Candidatus Microgenomates bacterium]